MDRGRRGSSRAIAGLSSACCACIALAAVACGDAFTTATPGDDGGGGLDAMVSRDTGADAGKGWCASQNPAITFCEDFTPGVPDMLATMPGGGGMLTADTTDFKSPPQSLLASTPILAEGSLPAEAIAYKIFSSAVGTHFSLGLELKIEPTCVPKGDNNGVSVMALEFIESNYGILIQVLPDEIDAYEISLMGSTTPTAHQFKISPPTGWQHWTLDVNGSLSLTAVGTKTFDLAIGATTLFSKEPLQKAPPTMALQHPDLVIGAIVKSTMGQAPACKVRVDDVLFNVGAVTTPL